ncbi:hypothetical protein H0A58_00990 [Alcaligenaceae bacterium]|nr:hypothetical protein [Alcaligenaceae bacterium]
MKQYQHLTPAALSWLQSILYERFGYAVDLAYTESGVRLTLSSQIGGQILFAEQFTGFYEVGLDLPCSIWDAEAEGWSSALGHPIPAPGVNKLISPLIKLSGQQAVVRYDILGLTYWMLNRIEEIGRTDLDCHGRFPATSSHAFKHGYLQRPVVDEWLNILGQVIAKTWPHAELRQHQFSMKVSHDVDSPSLYAFKPWRTVIRMMAGHLLKRRNIKAFFTAPYVKLLTDKNLHSADPYNTFDWLMDVSEAHNLKSAFYFICGHTSSMDADYDLEHPVIKELLQRIHRRGHEIGLHPSYGTYQKPEELKREAEHLSTVCSRLGITQERYGGRMHYLRWDHPVTLQAWNDANLSYDSTLTYADRPGFRCGTCFEYPAFNPLTNKELQLRIRPLIVMEATVIDSVYMGLSTTSEILAVFENLKNNCRQVKGCFTVLWHNSSLNNSFDCYIYRAILEI